MNLRLWENTDREEDLPREKHPSIEISDKDYLEIQNKRLESFGFIYKKPSELNFITPDLKKEKKIEKDEKIIDLKEKHAESKSKTSKRKSKKISPKSN